MILLILYLLYINYINIDKKYSFKDLSMATKDWQTLMALTRGKPLLVERVEVLSEEIHIEGKFELPPLAKLSTEDQVFVASFVRAHGSIKEMERLFGISYPTVKSRLNGISEKLGFLNVDQLNAEPEPNQSILDQLNGGTISVQEAIEKIKQNGNK